MAPFVFIDQEMREATPEIFTAEKPWTSELDGAVFEASGLQCMLLRGSFHVWCGYVGVPEGHLAYQRMETECLITEAPCVGLAYCEHSLGHILRVHGGISFAGFMQFVKEGTPLPRDISDGLDPLWFFGFDATHSGDAIPGVPEFIGTYRTQQYMLSQVERLAEQLAELQRGAESITGGKQ